MKTIKPESKSSAVYLYLDSVIPITLGGSMHQPLFAFKISVRQAKQHHFGTYWQHTQSGFGQAYRTISIISSASGNVVGVIFLDPYEKKMTVWVLCSYDWQIRPPVGVDSLSLRHCSLSLCVYLDHKEITQNH